MTEINTIKNGSQVIDLKPAAARASVESGSIERFGKPSKAGENGPAPTAAKSSTLDKDQNPLDKAAQTIEQLIGDANANTKLRIDKDDDTGRFVYKSVDSDSGEVIRQFPPETILQIISKFRDPEGLVLDDEA